MITLNPKHRNNEWVCYAHTISGIIIYVGVCRLKEVLDYPDARRNRMWQSIIKMHTNIAIADLFRGPQASCEQYATIQIAALRPTCNIMPAPSLTNKTVTRDDGVTYPTARTAAIANGISPGAMSNHLVGRKGYETIKGRTFTREGDI